jgi:hypothetical protein
MADHPEYTSLANVHRFNAGQMPVMQGLEDFYHFAEDDPARVANLVLPRPQAAQTVLCWHVPSSFPRVPAP